MIKTTHYRQWTKKITISVFPIYFNKKKIYIYSEVNSCPILVFYLSSKADFLKAIQAVRIEFFVYIKSCQYSMFYAKVILFFIRITKNPNIF